MRGARGIAAAAFALALAAAGVVAGGAARAQQSPSFSLTERTLNQGGRPVDGQTAASPAFALALDAIGDGVAAATLAGPSFVLEGGFAAPLGPPAEVAGLRFDGATAAAWLPAARAAAYHVYRGELPGLAGGDAGSCRQPYVPATAWTAAEAPAPGEGWFYLVTGVNRLLEESGRGRDSSGAERPATNACP